MDIGVRFTVLSYISAISVFKLQVIRPPSRDQCSYSLADPVLPLLSGDAGLIEDYIFGGNIGHHETIG